MSGEFALAQPEELSSRIVTENSASVYWWLANNSSEFAKMDWCTPLEKIPAAVCLVFSAILHTRVTARAPCPGNSALAFDIFAVQALEANQDFRVDDARVSPQLQLRVATILRRFCSS